LPRKLPAYTYEHALTVTDAELCCVHGIGPGRMREWRRFKANNPISNPLTEVETLQLEIDQLRTQLESREERVSELNSRLSAKDSETQNLVWQNQSLTYRINQMHKMLDMVRNGLTVPELRRIGFTVDISIPEEKPPADKD
jgi:predicted nuclease with TOPRIM domain